MGSYLWIVVLIWALIASAVAEFCFRKIHLPDASEPGTTTCRGLFEKQLFSSSRACCENKDGKAYARELITLGKRKRKWRCTPCWTDIVSPLLKPNGTGWSMWGEWSDCSVSCAVGTRIRQRLCEDIDPLKCDGADTMRSPCSEIPNCPVDGNWGVWNMWTDCTKTCSGGITQRTRRCNDPPPDYGGKDCVGQDVETKMCNTDGCPVNGAWSEWSNDGGCDVTCGDGTLRKRRLCNSPAPKNGGKFCRGRDFSVAPCKTDIKCPINGQWSLWSKYTSCTLTCGKGNRQRTRVCAAPRPKYGGKDCIGNSTDIQECYGHYPCPVDGEWTNWGNWSVCLARPCSNKSGIQTRSRTCSNPQPRFRGKQCIGATTDTRECYHNHNCPVHGQWCEWQPFSECRQAINNANFRIRVRDCTCPGPRDGGKTCQGNDFEVSSCFLKGEKDSQRRVRCGNVQLVDGLEGSGFPDDEDFC